MRYLRLLSINLLATLIIFFNIERLDFAIPNAINISSFVYVFGSVITALIIYVPTLQNMKMPFLIGLNTAIYIAVKVFVFNERPLWGGVYTYLSVTEVTLLSLLAWSAYKLAGALHDFEKTVESISFEDVSHCIQPLDEALKEVQLHMRVSRRHQRPLSLIIVEPEPAALQGLLSQAAQEVQRALMVRATFATLARTVSSILRCSDLMLEQRQRGRLIILCPETSLEGSTLLANRLQTFIAEQHGVSVRCGYASFPDKALTFEELVRKAEAQLGCSEQHAQYPVALNGQLPITPSHFYDKDIDDA